MILSQRGDGEMPSFYIKTNRVFSALRKFAWIFVPLVSFGGLYYPKLGLFVVLVMFSLMVLGLLKGKYWCGNLCPHGSWFDSIIMPFSFFKRIPSFFKSSITKWVFFAFYMVMFVRRVMKVAPFWGTMQFLDKLGFVMTIQYLVMPTIVGTILALFVNPRTWCSVCPMGSMEEIMYKLGKLLGINKKTDKKVTIAATEKCHKCGTCSRVCPMQLKPYLKFEGNNRFDEETCIRCGTCVENCPAEILSFENEKEAKELVTMTGLEGYRNKVSGEAVIEEVNQINDDIKEYTFKLKNPPELNYEPGQFILVKVSDEPEMYRAYSISSAEVEDKSRIRVTIKKVEGGYGTTIIDNQFKEGDTVELEGPMGDDVVIDETAEKVLLIAGGIGITPFVPVVKDIVENKSSIKDCKLIHGVNKVDEFIYDQYFAELDDESAKFEYLPTVAYPDENWTGYEGFVTDVLKQMDIRGYKLYLCGPKPMVNATLEVLEELEEKDKGVSPEDVFYESA